MDERITDEQYERAEAQYAEAERVIAAYYEQHKDDPAMWDLDNAITLPPSPKPARHRIATAATYNAGEIALIERMARALGCTFTELTRRAVLAYCQGAAAPTFTGASGDASWVPDALA